MKGFVLKINYLLLVSLIISSCLNAQIADLYRFQSVNSAMNAPCSEYFGIKNDGISKNKDSYYKLENVPFAVGNNRILYNLTQYGTFTKGQIIENNYKGPYESQVGASWTRTKDIFGKQCKTMFAIDGSSMINLKDASYKRVDFLQNLFPLFTFQQNEVELKKLVFAPVSVKDQDGNPPAVMIIYQVSNLSTSPKSLKLEFSGEIPLVAKKQVKFINGNQALIMLEPNGARIEGQTIQINLKPNDAKWFSIALCLAESDKVLKHTCDALQKQGALEWLNQTNSFHRNRFGYLTIPDDPYYAESFVQYAELCRKSLFVNGKGEFVGGAYATTRVVDTRKNMTWIKDNFYAVLPLCYYYPSLAGDAIKFLLHWGTPDSAFGRGLFRFPEAPNVLHSLSNSLSPFVLAGVLYQATGDKTYFKDNPEILDSAIVVLNKILETRPGDKKVTAAYHNMDMNMSTNTDKVPYLFHSMYISDGDARGDYHTGSNVLVWASFHHMARIAGEVFGRDSLAQKWNLIADKVKVDILKYCIGETGEGRRFFEGVNWDKTFIWGHDGEESDVALMPFYGFCKQDFTPLIIHSKYALSTQNPYYLPASDGIGWFGGGKLNGSTFPGWTTAIAGIKNEEELKIKLHRIRQLTDHNGSIYWWPYKRDAINKTDVGRWMGTTGWNAGVYLCMFTHNVLGLSVDENNIEFRPFSPWNEFAWTGCKLGNNHIDISYKHVPSSSTMMASLINQGAGDKIVTIELILPEGKEIAKCRLNRKEIKDYSTSIRYGRRSIIIRQNVEFKQKINLEVNYKGF